MALFAMAVPILPGKTEHWRRFTDELKGSRYNDFLESRKRMEVRERTFFQSTPHGDLVVVTLEGDDPTGAFQRFAETNDPFTRWFLQQAQEIHGIDLSQPIPAGGLPELVVDTDREAKRRAA